MSTTKERPMIFNAQEVLATLAGDKTQHRVLIDNTENTQCLFNGDWRYDGRDFLDIDGFTPDPKGCHYVERLNLSETEERQYTEDYRCIGHCPLGAIGDRLWVQEPTLAIEDFGWIGPVFVASDDGRNAIDWGYGPYDDPAHIPACKLTYNKSSAISRDDSRLLLEITDIRIERIKDISKSDAIAMGIKPIGVDPKTHRPTRYPDYPIDKGGFNSILQSFAKYWGSTHGIGAWDRNDWVWVVEFKAIKGVQVDGTD